MNRRSQIEALSFLDGVTTGVGMHSLEWVTNEDGVQLGHVPDYLNDKNATHALALKLSDRPPPPTKVNPHPKSDRQRYRETLCVVCAMNGGPIHATAAQESEALLRTMNLWEPSP